MILYVIISYEGKNCYIYIYIKFNDFKERIVIVNYLVYEIYVNELCCRFYYD